MKVKLISTEFISNRKLLKHALIKDSYFHYSTDFALIE
jgi:hypothetical protein